LSDQRITNINHQSDQRAQKRNGVEKSLNYTDGHSDPQRSPKEHQSEYKSQAHQKPYYQCPAQISADSIIESVEDCERQLEVAIRDQANKEATYLSVIETEKEKN